MNVSSTFSILSSSQGPWVRLTSFNLLSLPTLWAWILPQQTLESHTGRAQPPRLSKIIQVTLLCRDRAKNQWGEWPRKVPSHPLRNIQQSYQELQEMSWKPLGHASQQPPRLQCLMCNQPSNEKKHLFFMCWSQSLPLRSPPLGDSYTINGGTGSWLKLEREIIRAHPATPQPNHSGWYFWGHVNQAFVVDGPFRSSRFQKDSASTAGIFYKTEILHSAFPLS